MNRTILLALILATLIGSAPAVAASKDTGASAPWWTWVPFRCLACRGLR